MALLVESISTPLKNTGTKILSGLFAELGVFNQNGRRYPDSVYIPAYEELIPKVEGRKLLGELDHPLDYDEVRLSNVSHVITECHLDQSGSTKKIFGKVELLDTPAGKIAQALVKAGIPLGISSRGVGNTKKVSEGVDVTQLKLITYDLVADPSFKNAVLDEEKRNELAESLDQIEAKLPLNESNSEDSIRGTITRIRESFCYSDGESKSTTLNEDVKDLEIKSLRRVLESKVLTVQQDTLLLKKQRKQNNALSAEVSSLKESVASWKTRYTSIKESYARLQDEYNSSKEEFRIQESEEIRKRDAEIIELRKRLAVEQRGMSYSRVKNLLEGLDTDSAINDRLDSISAMNQRSVVADSKLNESIKESAMMAEPTSRLSKVISRV